MIAKETLGFSLWAFEYVNMMQIYGRSACVHVRVYVHKNDFSMR